MGFACQAKQRLDVSHRTSWLEYQREYRRRNPQRHRQYVKKWRKANPEKYRAMKKRYTDANPDKVQAWGRRKLYGLSAAAYDALLEAQDGKCAICNKTEPLAVDHDHKCCPGIKTCGNCIRGLLCNHCNRALGGFFENPDTLRGAIDYLARSANAGDTLPSR